MPKVVPPAWTIGGFATMSSSEIMTGRARRPPGAGALGGLAQSKVTTPRATWPVRSAAKPSLISSIL
jgi:hypothetical protein